MNNIEQYKQHLEYNGYNVDREIKDEDGYILYSEQYGPLSARGMGENGSLGIRLEKYYPISLSKSSSEKEKLELHEMVNEINRSLIMGTCYLFEDGGLMMSYPILGQYDKKNTSSILEGYHMDCQKMFDFNLGKYWDE